MTTGVEDIEKVITIETFHRSLLAWHMSCMSHAIAPKSGGAWLMHLKKRSHMLGMWERAKVHIPSDHHQGFLALMHTKNWHEGLKKSLSLCKYGAM